MGNIIESGNFVPFAKVQSIDSNQRLSDVYQQLNQSPITGSFVVGGINQNSKYVDAGALASAVSQITHGDASKWHLFSTMTVGEVIARIPPNPLIFDIGNINLKEHSREEAIPELPHFIFRVSDKGQYLGIYVKRDSPVQISTRRTVFICRRGHRNSDPDSGTCNQCPAPIVRTEEE